MDILIKSFNRPYYLDKCLKSIYLFVKAEKLNIFILDDGTPQKYLDKILEKYPSVSIKKSVFYEEKSKFINGEISNYISQIPIDLWVNSAKKATDFFLILEDDNWFFDYIDLDRIKTDIKSNNIKMLKLYWLGNSKLIPNKFFKKNSLNIFKANLLTNNLFVYKLIFHTNKLFINKLMKLLKINTSQRQLDYYKIYQTTGAIFDKNYFLNLWQNNENNVDEYLQIQNAIRFINKNKDANFGFLNSEIIKTGFTSAATNQNKQFKNIDVNMFVFNKILNENWFSDRIDIDTTVDKDLDVTAIEKLLDYKQNTSLSKTEWQKWHSAFRKQYTDFGCRID